MSSIVCKKTGIVIQVADDMLSEPTANGMLFFLSHPLSGYSQVHSTFRYAETKGGKYSNDRYRPLLAGSILTILTHHKLLKVHGDNQALWANNIMCKQARSTGQLLSLIHRLLNNEDKLGVISEGFQVKGERNKRTYKFCLESCMLQGQEQEGANKYFLKNLLDWIDGLLPASKVTELVDLDGLGKSNKPHPSLDVSITSIDLESTPRDELVEGIKNSIEDNIYRSIKRVSIQDIKRRLRDMVKLSASEGYNIISGSQATTLRAMVRNEMMIDKVLARYVSMLTDEAFKRQVAVQRNKLFEVAAWFKAADIEFQCRGMWATEKVEQVLGDVLGTAVAPKESLVEKLARINASKASKGVK